MSSRTSDDYRKRMQDREDRPYMRGLSKPEKLVRVEEEAEAEPEDETPMMMFWCVRHALYETEVCDGR